MKNSFSGLNVIISIFLLFFISQEICSQILEIKGNQFIFNKEPFKMWGIRVASASQNDNYTSLLLSSLDDYKVSGINSISVFFQGSSGNFSDPFSSDGKTIDNYHWDRMVKIIRACETRKMVVIVGLFYQRTMMNVKDTRRLSDEQAVINAVTTAAEKLKPFRNVIINVANEQNSSLYQYCQFFDFTDPEKIIGLCREVHKIDPSRIAGSGGYDDEKNIVIGKSDDVDVLLFDTESEDIEKGEHSGWKYDYYRKQGVPDKPMVNVEMFGGWTRKIIPPGVYNDEIKKIHIKEITEAKKRAGLSVHFHSNPWFQGPDTGNPARFDLGGMGTADDPGVRWWVVEIKK